MSQAGTQGCVAISIDTHGPQELSTRALIAERLADQLGAAGLKTTWVIAAHESSWGRTFTGQGQREWALRTTVNDGVDAAPAAWSRSWDQARCHGWRGATVSLAGPPSAAWLAWAQRHQVAALLPLGDASRVAAASRWGAWRSRFRTEPRVAPSAVRWGMWSFPPHARCGDGQNRSWRHPLERLRERGGLFHLVIELAWLVEGGRHAWRTIDLLSRVSTGNRDAGLESATLGELAIQFNRRPVASPSRSILRPAA